MKKLLLLSALLIFACSSDDEGNPCIYEPTLSTEAVTNITETSATLNGIIAILSENCDVALGEMQGFVYSTNPSPTNDDNVEVVYGTDISTTIDNLIPNTTYYVRVFITNSLGEFYGNEIDFTTNQVSLINCDGNPVPTIVYGTQEWTVENACHTTYRDGTPIPQVTDNNEWANLTTGAWCYYDNDPNKGVLYNWYAIEGIHDNDENTPNKEFAPEGWHVPMDNEWNILKDYLITNGYNYDGTTNGNKIGKSMASSSGWASNGWTYTPGGQQINNNSSGFNAFPEDGRTVDDFYSSGPDGGYNAIFWCLNPSDYTNGFLRGINSNSALLIDNIISKKYGLSARLVKD